MITLEAGPREEKTNVAVRDTVDIDIDSLGPKEQVPSATTAWSYSVPFPGVCYYSFVRIPGIKNSDRLGASN